MNFFSTFHSDMKPHDIKKQSENPKKKIDIEA
jgi:hypothetical protein